MGSAPALLDTLTELSAALNNDANYATTITNALAVKAPLASPTFTGTVGGITKAMVNLANVDNTADANKIVSSFTQTALNLKAPMASPALTGTATAVNLTVSGNLINGTTNVLTALSEKQPQLQWVHYKLI